MCGLASAHYPDPNHDPNHDRDRDPDHDHDHDHDRDRNHDRDPDRDRDPDHDELNPARRMAAVTSPPSGARSAIPWHRRTIRDL